MKSTIGKKCKGTKVFGVKFKKSKKISVGKNKKEEPIEVETNNKDI